MVDVDRRGFLKVLGAAGATAAISGCQVSHLDMVPSIKSPEDGIPGEATWFATTCRECPAGCGIWAKNRDGHVIKAEGNGEHPVNAGKLCPRGQASLQGLYNPDRFRQPLLRNAGGKLEPVSWDEAEGLLAGKIRQTMQKGNAGAVFLNNLVTGTNRDFIEYWLQQMGGGELVLYEPYAYEHLQAANRIVFGQDGIPTYHIDQADFLISFNAGFLETWISNVQFARQFAEFHAPHDGNKNVFVFVGPRRSMTAANSDLWIPVRPGDEYLIALAISRVMLDEGLVGTASGGGQSALQRLVADYPLDKVTTRTGVDPEVIRAVARRFAQAKRPLALADGLSYSGPNATATAVAANLLCTMSPGTQGLIDFDRKVSFSNAASAEAMKGLANRMGKGEVDLLLVHRANPVFTLPPSWNFGESIGKVPMVVSFSSWMDETTQYAHLILPAHTPLESWGDYAPDEGVISLMQPTMSSMFSTRDLGDILIATGARLKGTEQFPWKDFYQVMLSSWQNRYKSLKPTVSFENFWLEALQRGGIWEAGKAGGAGLSLNASFTYSFPSIEPQGKQTEDEFQFTAYPTIQFYDGRMANKPWIQELPDPLTQTTWGGWVEIHPETAEKLNVSKGDMVRITSPYGYVDAPVIPIFTVTPGMLAMPIGQGHTEYGRYATDLPANPLHLFPAGIDTGSGAISRPPFTVKVEKRNGYFAIANTDGSYYRQGRKFPEVEELPDYARAVGVGEKPDIDMPLPLGYKRDVDFYPPHPPVDYRWCMVVDMDRCIGCGACVVACYAENNLAVVGREHMLQQREMSWIMVERYFEREAPHHVRWLVMLCQHCTEAPCEAVCPVFAPQHNPEGLNNQVYNRCIGTRDCSQNDPYKVRRFNFFTYHHTFPLNWQLNPEVTVRQKGVMEKCSFCIQRINQARIHAKTEARKIRDGEFTTACAQTCPTDALIFGSLLDPDSRVSKLVGDPRAYQVLKSLNTKPAAIYLKKLTQEV